MYQTIKSLGFGYPETTDAGPACALIEGSDGTLYGTARNYVGPGSIFKVNKDGTGFKTLYWFTTNSGHAFTPYGNVLIRDGVLYGSTEDGGTARRGTVYRVNVDGSGFAILHHFSGPPSDGTNPRGPLVLGSNGQLYGVTLYGGRYDRGTIFRIETNGAGYELLRHFDGTNGQTL